MKSRAAAPALFLFASLALASLALGQEKMQKEMKKPDAMGMMKSGKDMSVSPLKSFSCDTACAFMMKSRDEDELVETAVKHMKKHHGKVMTEKEAKSMMKMETTGEMKE